MLKSTEPLALQIQPIVPAIGAWVEGVKLACVSDDEFAAIHAALLAYHVIFFRDQDLSSAQYLAFAGRFGEPVEYPFISGIEGFPVITPVVRSRRNVLSSEPVTQLSEPKEMALFWINPAARCNTLTAPCL